MISNRAKALHNKSNRTALSKALVVKKIPAEDPFKNIKWGIWAYFILLILEGALRKWVLPALATPLLVIRDPVAVAVLVLAWNKGIIRSNVYLNAIFIIGIVSLFTAMLLGHGNLAVAIFGARIFLIHFPFIFVMGTVFTRQDILKMGRVIVWATIPMAFLIAAQFYSPQSAWVNRGVGDDVLGAGFTGAMGYFRPPGTFSFTNGTTLFFGLASVFVIFFWLNKKSVNQLVLLGATASLLASIPLSISRALFFQIILSVFFALIASSRKPEYLGRMILAVLGAVIALALLSTTHFFQTATEAFTNRFDSAGDAEGGLEGVFLDRYLGGMIGAIENSSKEPFFGYGIGMGTNVGSMLLGGEITFLISEGEWGRLIGELGPLLGITVILIRVAFSLRISILAYRKLAMGDLLPWLLLAFFITNMPQGQWAQPTSLGFCIVGSGLIVAALNNKMKCKRVINNLTKKGLR